MVAYGEIGGADYYVGLQTNLVDTGNRGLIFSRWGDNKASHGRAANGGRIATGYENGTFISARVDHEWTTGDYSIVISQDGTDDHGMWYKAVLKTSPNSGINIGHLRFPFKDGFAHLTGSTYSTIEIYGESHIPITGAQVARQHRTAGGAPPASRPFTAAPVERTPTGRPTPTPTPTTRTGERSSEPAETRPETTSRQHTP